MPAEKVPSDPVTEFVERLRIEQPPRPLEPGVYRILDGLMVEHRRAEPAAVDEAAARRRRLAAKSRARVPYP